MGTAVLSESQTQLFRRELNKRDQEKVDVIHCKQKGRRKRINDKEQKYINIIKTYEPKSL